jgi:hypothetical protein
MGCIVYTVNCNSTTHATYLLTFTTYKYNELQMFGATQKSSCKASCKTPFFFIMNIHSCHWCNCQKHLD